MGNSNLEVFYGGEAFDELANCFRTKKITSKRTENLKDLLAQAKHAKNIYIIANYTAMFPLHDELTKLATD